MSTINERIQLVRLDWELNQVEFAKRLGVTNAHISKIEKGKTVPSPALTKLISEVYKTSEYWLLTGKGPIDSENIEGQVENEMVTANKLLSTLLRKDGVFRPMASKLNLLSSEIVCLNIKDDIMLIKYLEICHSLFFHINGFLSYKKSAIENKQQNLFTYPDNVLNDLVKDIDSFEDFFDELTKEK